MSSSDSDTDDSTTEALSRLTNHILNGDANRVVVLVGAGISTASGIPDFRTPGCGLYDNLSHYNLPWPEAVFDLEYFYSNPRPFYSLAKELYPTGRYRPNISHYFIRLLHEKSRLLRVYTQNIDGLERMAGIPLEKLVEAHGTFLSATCVVCSAKTPQKLVRNAIDRGTVAMCPECQNVIKPDIVFFGENLPERFWKYPQDVAQTDLVFVMGTSLEVYPFAGVADAVPRSVPRVLFNREAVGSFRQRNRPKDMVVLGSIAESVKRLAQLLNWYDELKDLMRECEAQSLSKQEDSSSGKKCGPSTKTNNLDTRPYSTAACPTALGHLITQFRSLSVAHPATILHKDNDQDEWSSEQQYNTRCSSPPNDSRIRNRTGSTPKSLCSKTPTNLLQPSRSSRKCHRKGHHNFETHHDGGLIAFRQYLFPSTSTPSHTYSTDSNKSLRSNSSDFDEIDHCDNTRSLDA